MLRVIGFRAWSLGLRGPNLKAMGPGGEAQPWEWGVLVLWGVRIQGLGG